MHYELLRWNYFRCYRFPLEQYLGWIDRTPGYSLFNGNCRLYRPVTVMCYALVCTRRKKDTRALWHSAAPRWPRRVEELFLTTLPCFLFCFHGCCLLLRYPLEDSCIGSSSCTTIDLVK